MKKPLSKALINFYGVGDLGFSLMTSVGMYLQTFFLTDVARFNLATVALIVTIPSTFDAIFSPVYGAIIDAVKPMRWGRLRSWLIITPPIVVVLMGLQYSKIGPDNIAAVIIIVSAILARPLFNTPWVANVALIPLLANNPQEKVLLSSRRGFWTNLSRVFFSYIGTPLAIFFGSVTGNPVMGYTILQVLMAMCMWLGYYIHFRMTDGYEELPVRGAAADNSKATAKKKDKASLGDILRNLFQNPPLIFLIIADYGRYMATFIITASVAYYFTYVAENMALMPFFMLVTSISAVLGSFATPIMNKRLNTRTTTIISAFLAGGFLIIAKLVGLQTYLFIIAFFFAQFFIGVLTSTLVALYSDTIIYGEWKTGKNTSGFIMGLMNLPLKVGSLTRGVVQTAALASIGFVAKMKPTPELKAGLINVFALIPAIGLLLTAVVILFCFKLTETRVKEMTEEINARKNAANA